MGIKPPKVLSASHFRQEKENRRSPIKYATPIVAAEIQARETFGFSSLSSKSIINYGHYVLSVSSKLPLFRNRTYPNPHLWIPLQLPNQRSRRLSIHPIPIHDLINLVFLIFRPRSNFISFSGLFTDVVVSLCYCC